MLISYNWLQTYFDEPLPSPHELETLLTMHVFEVEGIEEKTAGGPGMKKDYIIDVKVLPDRSPYCLSHRYIAQEIGAILNRRINLPDIGEFSVSDSVRELDIAVAEDVAAKNACTRYIGRAIESISVTGSPDWLKGQLEALGQRSISSIVDLTNCVMLETGEPLHAFDADKVQGNIQVRFARDGEDIVILDGTAIRLDASVMVIADDAGPLAIAGVKGGKRAEISSETRNIILEAACFDSALVRKTAQKVGIRNESSKRFENGVTAERAGIAMAMVTSHISLLNPDAKIGEAIDIYPNPVGDRQIGVRLEKIEERLGIRLSEEIVTDILTRCGLVVSAGNTAGELSISVPSYRPDLLISEDIVDEVGRIYGYEKIPGKVPEPADDRKILKSFHCSNMLRSAFANEGFSEVITYSLVDSGDMVLENPLTVERAVMRNNISELLAQKFLLNMKNADLLGLKEIKIFEIGTIFGGHKERKSVAFGIARPKIPKGVDAKLELAEIARKILSEMSASEPGAQLDDSRITFTEIRGDAQTQCAGFVAEIEFSDISDALPEAKTDADIGELSSAKYAAISPYPFSVRDVAVFVPGEAGREAEVRDAVYAALGDEGKRLLARLTLFDVFTKKKEGEPTKTSYAYRLVFQSHERTLTESEVNSFMSLIADEFKKHEGFEIR